MKRFQPGPTVLIYNRLLYKNISITREKTNYMYKFVLDRVVLRNRNL